MGYMRHHAIIVTTWDSRIAEIHEHLSALAAPCPVTGITPEAVNGYRSFLVAPDGSKEGWGASDDGDAGRARAVAWLKEHCDPNGDGPYCAWTLVQFGDDNDENLMLDASGGTSSSAGQEAASSPREGKEPQSDPAVAPIPVLPSAMEVAEAAVAAWSNAGYPPPGTTIGAGEFAYEAVARVIETDRSTLRAEHEREYDEAAKNHADALRIVSDELEEARRLLVEWTAGRACAYADWHPVARPNPCACSHCLTRAWLTRHDTTKGRR